VRLRRDEPVALLDARGRRHLVRLTGASEAVPRLGVVDTAALEGLEEGAVVHVGAAELLVVRPTAIDLVSAIERKAQIVLPRDAALIALHADVKPGDLVVEGGAGSGALGLVLLRLLRPDGRLVSYELRQDHAAVVRSNVERAGLGQWHTLKVADITQGIEERDVDAVVLDMGEPWAAVGAAVAALRPGGRLVSYSPTVGQVERTHAAAREAGLREVRTFETLERELVVGPQGTRPSFEMLGHTGYITAARKL
jgi:tRNA (adenine57-N1/adenine58-N1)-methyltransferase